MSPDHPLYRAARNIAVDFLKLHPEPTTELVRSCLDGAVDSLKRMGMIRDASEVDTAAILADLLHSYNVFGGSVSALDDPREHKEWLLSRRGSITWNFWRRYETWLEKVKKLPPPVVRTLGELTDKILQRLEDPQRDEPWDRRGMVVGSVQSGKTGNYTGLICKAADAGYRVIIVLAGMHNNLRSQTQLRLDEGFLGMATEKGDHLHNRGERKGVGLLEGAQELHVLSLTNSTEAGDFKRKAGNAVTGTLGGVPTLLVVKKNGSILKTLKEWLLHVGKKQGGKIRGVPLLLIDDEADQASINTKSKPGVTGAEKEDVTMINRRIREILAAFEQSAYVGYTATPFANIFINPAASSHNVELEDDIFPRSFILNVRPPSNYCGPARVFGLTDDPDTGIEGREALPLVDVIDVHEDSFPPKHKKDHEPDGLPESLIQAVRCFILICAARRARQQTKVHNSMLIHVTRFVDVQARVAELVSEEFDGLRKRITYGDGGRKPTVQDELRQLWEEEFGARDATLRAAAPDEVGEPVTWEQVAAELHDAASRIEIKQINGTAGDVLDYVNHPEGFSVIAVGGDKLSRGLTLEGLSVSYFLRASRMYDTLMQMGRWFGYRSGYLDLCRLYTTEELRLWYRHIALAEEELRREFDYMAESRRTPEDYGLRVREHPAGLLVTALNKMCHAQTLSFSYAGALVQTAHFATDPKVREANVEALEQFATQRPKPTALRTKTGQLQAWLWENVPAAELCDELLARVSIHPQCHTVDSVRVREFIQRQQALGELAFWTIALVSNAKELPTHPLARVKLALTERAADPQAISSGRYSTAKANIQSPSHQAFDLANMTLDGALLTDLLAKRQVTKVGATQYPLFDPHDEALLRRQIGKPLDNVALALTRDRAARAGKEEPREVNGLVLRQLRPVSRGLLLLYALTPDAPNQVTESDPPYLGFVFSFPSSHTARRLSYKANQVLIQQLRDGDYGD